MPRLPQRPGGKSWFPVIIGAIALIWIGVTTLHMVGPKEQGIVTTFGKYTRTVQPGVSVTLPWPIQNVQVTDVTSINRYLGEGGDAAAPMVGGGLQVTGSRPLGAVWLLQGLWRQLDIDTALSKILGPRRFRTDVERVLFALVAKRAVAPASKLSASRCASYSRPTFATPSTSSATSPAIRARACRSTGSSARIPRPRSRTSSAPSSWPRPAWSTTTPGPS